MLKREVFLVGGKTDVLVNTKLPTSRSVSKLQTSHEAQAKFNCLIQ